MSYRLKIGVCVCDTGGRQVSVHVIQMEGRCVRVSYRWKVGVCAYIWKEGVCPCHTG